MPDTENTEDTTEDTEGSTAGDDLGDAGKKALAEERKARRALEKQLKDIGSSNSELQKQLKDYEDRNKSETEKAIEAANAVAGERDSFKSENERLQALLQRQKISATQGLDPELWDRVQGSTVEEIEADVKKLVEKFSVTPKRAGALRSGASVPEGASGKRGAAALRGLRRD